MSNQQNLKPFTSDYQPTNNGRPKGSRSLSTVIKNLLEEPINWDLMPVKSKRLADKYRDKVAWEALVYMAFYCGMQGDIKAMSWLSKSAYGDKIGLTLDRHPVPILGDVNVSEKSSHLEI